MAAFQQYPASLDSVFLPNNNSNVSAIKTPGNLDEFIPNFNQFYSPFENTQKSVFVQKNQEGSSIDVSAHESSSLEQLSINKTCSLSRKQRTEGLSMADKDENGEQVTQNCVNGDKKRKSRKGSSLFSANIEEVKQVKSKKQKEAKNEGKAIEEPPKGYIHVRARRGQATDSHSLAERLRREKISERMKMLQALVPGCDKVTGKALMLDEIINYVQSLQNQVEFLSMKLASLDPMVYTFGLMDHDPMLFGTQAFNNSMALMQPTSNGGNRIDQTQDFANTHALSCSPTSSATTSNFHDSIVESSANLFQSEQKPSLLPLQDAGNLCWEVNEQQRRSIINQFGLFCGTNLYSLH